MADSSKTMPLASVRRLPLYLRFLKQLRSRGREVVSCTHIARELGLVSTQVRKDLAMTGIVGKPKVGYDVAALVGSIEGFLGWNHTRNAFVVGVGSLGSALMGYEGFTQYGLNVLAGFDIDPHKIGTQVHAKQVYALEQLPDLVSQMQVLVGILTVPAKAAPDVANLMVLSGMRAIWNYAPATLEVPDSIVLENMNLSASLAVLSSRLEAALGRHPRAPSGKTVLRGFE